MSQPNAAAPAENRTVKDVLAITIITLVAGLILSLVHEITLEPELLLRGLNALYKRNRDRDQA